MRILLLTILFLGPLYYFNYEEEVPVPEIDSVKLKLGAPAREERLLTAKAKVVEEKVEEKPETASRDITSVDEGHAEEDMDQVEEVQWTDLEEGWNNELKGMLNRLEPADGDDIYKRYMKEQESYQAALDSLMNEKQQKESDEEINEMDQLIAQLDSKHQDNLREILGAHYEAVRDQYQYFMESSEEE